MGPGVISVILIAASLFVTVLHAMPASERKLMASQVRGMFYHGYNSYMVR